MTPFDLAAHTFLLENGYTHKRVEADWEDIGDAENGPELSGGPAFDEYTDSDSSVVIGEDGQTGFNWRDFEMEKMMEEWEVDHS